MSAVRRGENTHKLQRKATGMLGAVQMDFAEAHLHSYTWGGHYSSRGAGTATASWVLGVATLEGSFEN